jgi:hypothetical protein
MLLLLTIRNLKRFYVNMHMRYVMKFMNSIFNMTSLLFPMMGALSIKGAVADSVSELSELIIVNHVGEESKNG